MAKKHKCPECPAGEKWAVPYADFLSLLLALFIALWAISETNPAKVEALKTEFVKIFDYTTTQAVKTESQNTEKHAGASRTPNDEVEALKRLTLSQQETIKKLKAALDQSENQIALNLPSRVEFAKNSAEIVSADMQDYLKRMAQLSLSLPPQAKIEIRGFTDNSDSALRSFELGSERVSIKSYGFNEPLLNHAPSDLANNRVEIYFKVDIDDDNAQKSILELLQRAN